MFALKQRKKQWEHQNEKVLLQIVQTSSDVSLESVKMLGLLTSFMLFLVYKIVRAALAVCALQVQPYQLQQEHLNLKMKSPFTWR
ncbi:MAG: hypothetical protein EOP06_23385 [Proteobacteria bacterium]|nr:MAG: hypothetical protein EOP06_23385 [Pseudomonadota bacterium]